MAFTIGSGTFTNGSATVTGVTLTSGTLAYFASGTRMVVGVNPVIQEVEAIAAPTVSTITLRSAWTGTGGTYSFLANQTSEGLRDAVQAIRTNNASLQSFIDSIDTAATADSVAQRDASGQLTATNLITADKIIHDGDTNTAIRFPAADTVTVETDGVERLRVTSVGNVGIGNAIPNSFDQTQSSPSLVVGNGANAAGLTLYGGTAATGSIAFADGTDSSSQTSGRIAYTHAGDFMRLFTAGTERLRIDSSGNVGIGRLPSLKFDVLSGVNNTDIARFTGTQTAKGLVVSTYASNGNDGGARLSSTDSLAISTNSAERLRITSSGNVGIGLTNSAFRFGIEQSSVDTLQRLRRAGNTTGAGRFPLINCVGASSTDSSGTGVAGFGVGFKTRYADSQEFYTAAVLGHHYQGFKGGLHFYVQTAGGGPGSDSTGQGIESTGAANTVGSLTNALIINSDGSTTPGVDNSFNLGSSGFRFDDIYATNGTIQTSDRNEKQDIEELSEAEHRVALACKSLLRKFRWKSSVEEKGDDARIHFGIIAQDLQAAFEAEGLDAGKYAMFIHTDWWEHEVEVPAVEAQDAVYETVTDEDGNETEVLVSEAVEAVEAYTRTETYFTEEEAPDGAVKKSRMGVRYSELLAFIIAGI